MRNITPLLILTVLLTGACTRDIDTPRHLAQNSNSQTLQSESSSAFIPGSVIVQFDEALADRMADAVPDTKASALSSELTNLGVVKMERLFPDAGEWEPRHREAGLHRWYRLTFDTEARTSTKAAVEIAEIPGVVYSEPERRTKSTAFFDDPYAQRQWSFYNDGSLGSSFKPGADINVVPVWDNYTAGSPDVIVAILDGGVQLDHPDLAAITILGGENGSKCFVDGLIGYEIPGDDHGTHVAGVIAAVNNNGIGISGIAGGRDGKGGVRILSCPFMLSGKYKDRSGNPAEAMAWAADHGAVISQNSWGYVYETEQEAKDSGLPSYMVQAINYFNQYAGCDENGNQRPDSPMKGGVVFFAAGNEAWSMAWPAAHESVIAVGATNAQNKRTSYSNYGDWVDICAPGGEASGSNTPIFSTISESKYGNMQGTSMACPHVSGVAALIISYYGGQGFTADMLKDKLLRGASSKKVGKDQMIGPLVDALGSFTLDSKKAPEPATDVTATTDANTITMSWSVTEDSEDVKAYGYKALAATDADSFRKIDLNNIPEDVKAASVTVGTTPIGDAISATLDDLAFETDYYIAVAAYDYRENYSALSEIQTIRTGKNTPPVVTTDYTGDYIIRPFDKITVEYAVSDPDGHSFTLEVTPGSDAVAVSTTSTAARLTFAGNAAPHGKYTAHIVATDSYGAVTDYVIDYEILENHAPVVIAQIPNMLLSKTGESTTIDLTKYIKDEDGEQLSYNISVSDGSVAHVNASGTKMVLTTLAYGLTSVTFTATDACKASCTLNFKVLVRDSSEPIDLYPNPVVDKLNIRPAEEGQVKVSVTNKVGATVKSESGTAGPFDPMAIDMSDLPGGVYYARVEGPGVNQIFPIAKK